MHTKTRTLALTLTLALGLTACATNNNDTTTATPTPTTTTTSAPSPSPTPTPTLSEKDQAIQEAKATYTTFIESTDAASNAGYTPETVGPVLAMTAPDGNIRLGYVSEANANAEAGVYTKGSSIIGSMTATDYTEPTSDNGWGATVTLDVCVDSSGITYYIDGEKQELNNAGTMKSCARVTFIKQDSWLLNNGEVLDEEYH